MLDLLSDQGFQFWVPIQLQKAKGTSKDDRRWIEGIASTTDLDLQNEIVQQNGIDFSYFLKHGYFNNDHKPGFENKVGQPTECRVTSKGLYVKGYLFKNHKVADAIWELVNSLEASQSDRKVGFSIQGKVLRRAGKTIVKCWIQDVAITASPINTNTWLDVVKGLNALPSDIWCDETGCFTITPDIAAKALKQDEGKCCGACNCTDGGRDQMKSVGAPPATFTGVAAHMAIDPSGMDLKKKDQDGEDQDKAFAATSQAGRDLTPESLEGRATDLGHGRTDPEHRDDKDTKKSLVPATLSFDESVAWLQAYRSLTQPEARIVAKAVFTMNGLTN
jgi:hypothetical protein